MYQTRYHRPGSSTDAVAAIAAADDGAFLAGGQTLLPTMKQRLAAPSDVIDLRHVGDLQGITEEGETLVIGAMTTHADMAGSDIVRRAIPALGKLAGGIGDPHVRHMGTIGGSIANNDPAADYPAAALALGATIRTDKRTISADDFFTGLFSTALEDGELITAIAFPKPQAAAYQKVPHPASRYAMAGVFVARTGSGVRVAVTGAGSDGVFRFTDAENALGGNFSAAALDGVTVDAGKMISDKFGPAKYRANLVAVLTRRAVADIAG